MTEWSSYVTVSPNYAGKVEMLMARGTVYEAQGDYARLAKRSKVKKPD